MTQLSRKKIAEIIINQKEWSDQEWTDATGISRQTFWRMRNNKIKGVESKTLELMARASDQKITWKDHTKNQGQLITQSQTEGKNMIDIEYTLNLYRETIELQKEKIINLQQQLSPTNPTAQNVSSSVSHENVRKLAEDINVNSEFSRIVSQLEDTHTSWNYLFYNTHQPLTVAKNNILTNANLALTEILGYSEKDMVGKGLLEFIHKEDHKWAIQEMAKPHRNGQFRLKKKNGEYVLMKIVARQIGNGGSESTHNLGILTLVEQK